ncbi:MAG: DUF1573 domain-containing protein [Prevotella sp.]|nr:DUF1573 domain-containing protein [Prevotella sp.]
MLLADTLIVIGMATVSLGTIQEADGVKEHTFWLRNSGTEAVALQQGYTSCGCTTIHFEQGRTLQCGDSTAVKLRFNPQGKGGEFHEVGTLVYGERRKRVQLTLTGTCVTSEETLLRQFPIRINDWLRLSANRFDLGIMRQGEAKERGIVVLYRKEGNRKERIPIRFTATADLSKGLHHIDCPVTITTAGRQQEVHITLDVLIQ